MARGGHCSDQNLDRVVCLSIANKSSKSFRLHWCFYLGLWLLDLCIYKFPFFLRFTPIIMWRCLAKMLKKSMPAQELRLRLHFLPDALTISNWPCLLSSMDIGKASTQRIKVLRLVLLELIWFRRQAFCDDIAKLLLSCQISKASMSSPADDVHNFMIVHIYLHVDYYVQWICGSFTALKIK